MKKEERGSASLIKQNTHTGGPTSSTKAPVNFRREDFAKDLFKEFADVWV